MGTAVVFDPDADYGRVDAIRKANAMPSPSVHLVASVTGPWKVVSIVDFDALGALPGLVNGLAAGAPTVDPGTAYVIGFAQVKRSVYGNHMAFVRIDVGVADPDTIRREIEEAVGSEEVDVVAGDFDVFACVADDDEGNLASKIFAIRSIPEVTRTVSLRIIDYVVNTATALHPGDIPEGHRIPG